ncbi:uncharacterized protein LOC114289976 isoform X3 [Camellia sinensis]|uniref:uncharacterized protein LOC114289976 isoform X3 n=1 Tax=Camellia sinensis TaxID=4442 RepID=UPI00103585BF|nr:uncharacterized protein LOC114289976 isoform X3 [Camellia sinensis]
MAVGSYYYCVWPSSSSSSISPLRKLPYSSSLASSSCHCCRSSPSHSLSPVNTTLSHIKNTGVIACLRAQSAELAMEAACAALNGGISVLEIVMSTPGVFEVLQQLVQDYPTTTLGLLSILQVGTVLNSKDAKNAINAGAKFLMSPAMVKDIMDDAQGSEALYIPGVMTPTEVYPVSVLGGIPYISTLNRPFSHISMIASQGITIDLIGEYIENGASAVVLSDAIFDKEAMDQRNFDQIRQLAHLAALRGNKAIQRYRRNQRKHRGVRRQHSTLMANENQNGWLEEELEMLDKPIDWEEDPEEDPEEELEENLEEEFEVGSEGDFDPESDSNQEIEESNPESSIEDGPEAALRHMMVPPVLQYGKAVFVRITPTRMCYWRSSHRRDMFIGPVQIKEYLDNNFYQVWNLPPQYVANKGDAFLLQDIRTTQPLFGHVVRTLD